MHDCTIAHPARASCLCSPRVKRPAEYSPPVHPFLPLSLAKQRYRPAALYARVPSFPTANMYANQPPYTPLGLVERCLHDRPAPYPAGICRQTAITIVSYIGGSRPPSALSAGIQFLSVVPAHVTRIGTKGRIRPSTSSTAACMTDCLYPAGIRRQQTIIAASYIVCARTAALIPMRSSHHLQSLPTDGIRMSVTRSGCHRPTHPIQSISRSLFPYKKRPCRQAARSFIPSIRGRTARQSE